MRCAIRSVAVLVVAIVLTACGDSSPKNVPDVVGKSLDAAEGKLDSVGLDHETKGGGAFGIVVKSNWTVCKQRPASGTKATSVTLTVDRECRGTTHEDSSSAEAQVSTPGCMQAMTRLAAAARSGAAAASPSDLFPTVYNCVDVGDWVSSYEEALGKGSVTRATAVSIINSTCSIAPAGTADKDICVQADLER